MAHFRPRLIDARQEEFIVVLLNGQNKFLREKSIAIGTPTQTIVYVRRVMEEALRVSASTIVLIHNHPSGNAEPSKNDDVTTLEVNKAANILGLLLLDHIIIGEQSHFSYMDSGRLNKLQKNMEI